MAIDKDAQTRTIKQLLNEGQSPSAIARSVGVSWRQVTDIKRKMDDGTMADNARARQIARAILDKQYEEHVNQIKARRAAMGVGSENKQSKNSKKNL